MRRVPWTQHALRQMKLLIPGAVMTYYLGTLDEFWDILHGNGGSLAQSAAFIVSLLGLTTIGLFLYVLFLPLITGEEPDYRTWRESRALRGLIPILTISIVVGWLVSVSTLGHWSHLGYVKGSVGVSAFYALTFGVLGLIPVPKTSRKLRD